MTETSRPDAYVAYGLIFCIPNIAVASSCASTLTNTQLRRTFWRRISGNLVSPHTGQITQSNARTNARARIHTHTHSLSEHQRALPISPAKQMRPTLLPFMAFLQTGSPSPHLPDCVVLSNMISVRSDCLHRRIMA